MAVLAPLVALCLAMATTAVLFALIGVDPLVALRVLMLEPSLGWVSCSQGLLKMGPLLLITQGPAIGFQARIFNIGAE